MNKKILAIIPARGGSKGVKRKNIRYVASEPLIYWSIKACKESRVISNTYVNTDDFEIATVAKAKGAEVIMRPAELAEDKTPMIPVLQYAVAQAEAIHGKFDTIILIQPTAPLRTSLHIDESLKLFEKSNSLSMVSVYQVDDCHPSRMYKIDKGELVKFYEEPLGALRQDLEPIFHRNGAIYICNRDLLINNNRLTCDFPLPYIMLKSESVNIDDEEDLKIADFLMKEKIRD